MALIRVELKDLYAAILAAPEGDVVRLIQPQHAFELFPTASSCVTVLEKAACADTRSSRRGLWVPTRAAGQATDGGRVVGGRPNLVSPSIDRIKAHLVAPLKWETTVLSHAESCRLLRTHSPLEREFEHLTACDCPAALAALGLSREWADYAHLGWRPLEPRRWAAWTSLPEDTMPAILASVDKPDVAAIAAALEQFR